MSQGAKPSFAAARRLPLWLADFVVLGGMLIVGQPAGATDKINSATTNKPAATGATLEVLNLKNQPVNPLNNSHAKAIVLVFVRPDCPISNRYAPEIERLHRKFGPQKTAWWLVYTDEETTPAEITRHLADYHLSLEAVRDPAHQLVKRAGVSVTPEAAVFLPDGSEVYHGRIDDRYADFGKERPQARRHDLQEVLNAVLEGRKAPPSQKAVGCYITEKTEQP